MGYRLQATVGFALHALRAEHALHAKRAEHALHAKRAEHALHRVTVFFIHWFRFSCVFFLKLFNYYFNLLL